MDLITIHTFGLVNTKRKQIKTSIAGEKARCEIPSRPEAGRRITIRCQDTNGIFFLDR